MMTHLKTEREKDMLAFIIQLQMIGKIIFFLLSIRNVSVKLQENDLLYKI